MRFNQSQSRAIDHFTGPSLVLAGPGSGKTTVITHRIHNLIRKYHVKPEKILVATFSRSAAEEMQQRFTQLCPETPSDAGSPLFGTFHGIFYGFLRSIPGFHAGRIISDEKKEELLRTALEEAGLSPDDDVSLIPALSGDISRLKSDLYPDEVFFPSSVSSSVFYEIFESYAQALSALDLFDFDDILLKTHELLCHRRDVLTQLQCRFSFYLIDEFQDISRLQYEIMKLLSARERNLFAVGDDDQAIYSFRGASSGIMKQFLKDFPDTQKITLHFNYRSAYPIMDAALKVIGVNKDRFQKNIRCFRTDADADAFQLDLFPSSREEMAAICDHIQRFRKEGISYDQIAILCRSSMDHAFLQECLMEHQIPVRGKTDPGERFRKDLLQDFSCYMKAAMEYAGKIHSGSCSKKELLRIINRPSRFLSRDAFPASSGDLSGWLDALKKYYGKNGSMQDRIRKLEQHLSFLAGCAPYAAISYIWNAVGYQDYIRTYCREHHQDAAPYEKAFLAILEDSKALTTFRQWEEKMTEKDPSKDAGADEKHGVSLMTMHASKGLEFDIVFLPGLNEGRIPHKKAVTKEAVREERRLLYVAMTRAKKHLYLSYVENYRSKKATPSRFLDCFLQ